jgi:hypothetical protein
VGFKNSYTNIFNQTKTAWPDILWQSALGYNPELSNIRKFGRNTTVAASTWEDIWDYGGDYNWPSDSGVTLYISSSDAADTQSMVVQGLDENFILKQQEIELQGVTFVQLEGKWARVYRAYNNSSTDNAGTIYISSDNTDAGGDGIPDVTTSIHATVPIGENQTLQCPYTVPADTEMYVASLRANLMPVAGGTIKQCKISVDIRPFGKVWRTQSTLGLITSGSSWVNQELPVPSKLAPKTDIRVRGYGIGAAVDIDAAYIGVLISV